MYYLGYLSRITCSNVVTNHLQRTVPSNKAYNVCIDGVILLPRIAQAANVLGRVS